MIAVNFRYLEGSLNKKSQICRYYEGSTGTLRFQNLMKFTLIYIVLLVQITMISYVVVNPQYDIYNIELDVMMNLPMDCSGVLIAISSGNDIYAIPLAQSNELNLDYRALIYLMTHEKTDIYDLPLDAMMDLPQETSFLLSAITAAAKD